LLNILCSIHQFIIHTFLLSLSSVLSNKHDRTFHHCFAGWLSRRGTAWLGSPVLTSVSNGPIFLIKVNIFLRKVGHSLDRFGVQLGLFFATTDLSCQSHGIPWLATLAVETGLQMPSVLELACAQTSPNEVQNVPDFPTENMSLAKGNILVRILNKTEVGSVLSLSSSCHGRNRGCLFHVLCSEKSYLLSTCFVF